MAWPSSGMRLKGQRLTDNDPGVFPNILLTIFNTDEFDKAGSSEHSYSHYTTRWAVEAQIAIHSIRVNDKALKSHNTIRFVCVESDDS